MADEQVKPMLPEMFAPRPKDLPRSLTEFLPVDLFLTPDDGEKEDKDKED